MSKLSIIFTFLIIGVCMSCKSDVTKQSAAKGETTTTNRAAKNTAPKGTPTVEVVHPTVREFNADQVVTGTVKADKSIYLHAMEQGKLEKINVDIGDPIYRGQKIAILSNPILDFELKKATSKKLQTQANLQAADAQLSLRLNDRDISQNIYDRLSSVQKSSPGLTTMMELENAKRDAAMANSQVEVARAEISKCNADVSAAELMINAIQERVNMLTIKAPFAGVVSGRFSDPGAMIQNALTDTGAKPIISIESTNPVRLILPIPESDISGIAVGDEIDIEFPSMKGANLTAKISRISRSLDPTSKTMEVQVDIPNPAGKIKSGMYAKARVRRSSGTDLLSLPHSAVNMRADAAMIYQVVQGKVIEVKLKKGITGKDYFQVLNDEITTSSQVIVKGKSSVTVGQEVNAILK